MTIRTQDRNRRRRLLSFAMVVLCITTILSGPIAVAQQTPINGTNSTNGSTGNNTTGPVGPVNITNGTNNSSLGNGTNQSGGGPFSGGGGGGGGGGSGGGGCSALNPAGCIPSTEDVLNSSANFVMGGLNQTVQPAVSEIVNLTSGMPAPGEFGDPLSWTPGVSSGNPDSAASNDPGEIAASREEAGGLWNDMYQVWILMMGLAAVIFTLSGTWLFASANPYEFRREIKPWAWAFAMAVLTWVVAPLGLHIGRRLSLAIAPSAAELTGSFGGASKLGLGVIVGVVFAIFNTGVLLTAVFLLLVEYLLVHVVVALWPVGWALTTTRNNTLQSIGSTILYLYGMLIVLYVAQAILLRIGFSFDWAVSLSGFTGFLFSTIVLAAALIYLPMKMIEGALSAGIIQLGIGDMTKKLKGMSSYYDRRKSDSDAGGNDGDPPDPPGGGGTPVQTGDGRQTGRQYGSRRGRRTAADGGAEVGVGMAGIRMTEAAAEKRRNSGAAADSGGSTSENEDYSDQGGSWYAPTGDRTVSGSNRDGRDKLGQAGINATQAAAEGRSQSAGDGQTYSNVDAASQAESGSTGATAGSVASNGGSSISSGGTARGRDRQGRAGIDMTRSAAFDRQFETADGRGEEQPAESPAESEQEQEDQS